MFWATLSFEAAPDSVRTIRRSLVFRLAIGTLLAALAGFALPAAGADEPPPARLRTWTVIDTHENAAALDALARRHDLLIVDPQVTNFEPPEAARQANPNVRIVALLNVLSRHPADRWWRGIHTNEHWFFRDAGQNRIRIAEGNRPTAPRDAYAMDIGQPPYRTWCLRQALLLREKGFDGILLQGIVPYNPYGGQNVSAPPAQTIHGQRLPFTDADIFRDMHALLRTITQGIDGDDFPVWIHAIRSTHIDGSRRLAQEAGGAAMQPPLVEDSRFNALQFEPRLNLAREMTRLNKTVLFDATFRPGVEPAAQRGMVRLALGAYLLSESPITALRFTGEDIAPLKSIRQRLGRATGDAEKTESGLWTRAFEHGRVVVNPGGPTPAIIELAPGESLLFDTRIRTNPGGAERLPIEGPGAVLVVMDRNEL